MSADKKKVKDFLYEELTYKIRGAMFVVHKELGSGHIEIKAVPLLARNAEVQLSHYLRGTNYKLGLLVNFGAKSLDIRRRIWTNQYNQLKSA